VNLTVRITLCSIVVVCLHAQLLGLLSRRDLLAMGLANPDDRQCAGRERGCGDGGLLWIDK
jgi:hypothetical protein